MVKLSPHYASILYCIADIIRPDCVARPASGYLRPPQHALQVACGGLDCAAPCQSGACFTSLRCRRRHLVTGAYAYSGLPIERTIPVGSTLIKADLAQVVYERHGGVSYKEAMELVELILARMKESLAKGENVKMSGFGSLNVIQRKGRLGRNPQTGDRIKLMPSKYVTFRPSRLLEF